MKKFAVLAFLCSAAILGAFEFDPSSFMGGNVHSGAIVSIDSNTTVSGELTALGAVIDVKSDVPDDVFLMGADIKLSSNISHNLTAMGAVIDISGNISGKTDVAGASVYLDGVYEDSLKASGAAIFIRGHIKAPATITGAVIVIEDGAIIEGKLRYAATELKIDKNAQLLGGTEVFVPEEEVDTKEDTLQLKEDKSETDKHKRTFPGWLAGTIIFLLILMGAGLFVALVFPRHLKTVSNHIMVNPGASALTGGIALIASPIVLFIIGLLIVTIIGILPALFLLIIYAIGILLSGLYAGTALSRFILTKARNGKEPHIVLSMLMGTGLAVILTRIPYVGIIFGIAAFIFGFGAFLISIWFEIKPKQD